MSDRSDPSDSASLLEARQRAEAEAQRARLAAVIETPRHDREGKRICLDCEDRLSQKRLDAEPRAVRCVECQVLQDKRQRGYRA